MNKYILRLPDRLKGKEKDIYEYLIVKQWEDNILTSGACAKLLGVWKYDFQTKILGKYGIYFDD